MTSNLLLYCPSKETDLPALELEMKSIESINIIIRNKNNNAQRPWKTIYRWMMWLKSCQSQLTSVTQHHWDTATLILPPTIITSVACSLSILFKTTSTHLYASVHKFTHFLPPITVYWTKHPRPGFGTCGCIDTLSLLKLTKGHCVFLHGYRFGQVISTEETTNPNYVLVTIK